MRFFAFLSCLFLLSCSAGNKGQYADQRDNIPTEKPNKPIPPIRDDQVKDDYFYFEEQEDAILSDLNSLDDATRRNTRYIMCSDQLNAFGTQDAEDCKRAVSKTLNSISSERRLINPKAIGTGGSILRFDMRDIGMTPNEWRLIENLDPFKFTSQTVRGKTIQFLTQAVRPFIVGNNFAEVALVKAYYTLEATPATIAAFEQKIGANVQADFDDRDEEMILIGMNESVIAANRQFRLIRRVDAFDGPLWCTFDTNDVNIAPININGQLVNQKNLLEAPFPKEARSNKQFVNDAGECIYTKPNGMLGFAIFNAVGAREDFAATNIVQDTGSAGRGLSGTIQNARSCFRCHATGMIPARDTLAQLIQESTGFNAADKSKARLFFKGPDAGLAFIRGDNADFSRTMAQIGINDTSDDPINRNIDRLRLEQNAKQVAGTLGISEQELLIGLRSSTGASSIIGALSQPSGTVNLQQLIDGLPILIADMNLFQDDI
jgi:hypothetical protein